MNKMKNRWYQILTYVLTLIIGVILGLWIYATWFCKSETVYYPNVKTYIRNLHDTVTIEPNIDRNWLISHGYLSLKTVKPDPQSISQTVIRDTVPDTVAITVDFLDNTHHYDKCFDLLDGKLQIGYSADVRYNTLWRDSTWVEHFVENNLSTTDKSKNNKRLSLGAELINIQGQTRFNPSFTFRLNKFHVHGSMGIDGKSGSVSIETPVF